LEASVEAQARNWVEQGGADEAALQTLSAESIAKGFKVVPANSDASTRRVGYL